MATEFKLQDILAMVDCDGKEVWDELTDDQRKSVVFYTLNRYISNVVPPSKPFHRGKTPTLEEVEDFVLNCNEFFNKNLFAIISKHPKLTWLSACSCNFKAQLFNHEWISLKKEKDKKLEFLAELFPNMKRSDLETLSAITTDKDIKRYCEDLGWDKKQINGIKL
jgi:hypothetical protein